MSKTLFRAGALAGVGALVASLLIATATATQAAAGFGYLEVHVVDQYGRPAPGLVQIFPADGSERIQDPETGSPVTSNHSVAIPAGDYGIVSITPWTGWECAGVSPCAPAESTPLVTPVATVGVGQTTRYTFHATVPWITGDRKIGSRLAIHIPKGLAVLQDYVQSEFQGGGGSISQQWRRGQADISNATGGFYTTTPLDGSRNVSARLTTSSGLRTVFSGNGIVPQPLTTNAITVAKFQRVKTKTSIDAPKHFKRGAPVTVTVKVRPRVKTKAKVSGSVLVRVGLFKVRKKLHNGRVFVNLPRLAVGKHTIKVKYSGSTLFVRSKSKVTVYTTR